MVEHQADPAATLRLLWGEPVRPPSGRGRRPTLDVPTVVDAAIELADHGGEQAITMRRVAEAIGVTPMSLYTYIPGKRELLDLMLDTVFARMSRAEHGTLPWRARAERVADENRQLYRQHPWAAAVSPVRPPLGPGQLGKYEHELRVFDGTGLTDVQTDSALTFLLGFVRSTAEAARAAALPADETEMSDAEWWAANQPLLARVLDPAKYPTAVRVGEAAGAEFGSAYDPEHAYLFGLTRVLDGLAVLIEGAAADSTSA